MRLCSDRPRLVARHAASASVAVVGIEPLIACRIPYATTAGVDWSWSDPLGRPWRGRSAADSLSTGRLNKQCSLH
jgi:hypothetical protein